jgi:hypothetical protein
MKREVTDKVFDFQADDPERLLSSNDIEWLFRSVRVLPGWTERALAVTAAALSYWVSRAILRGSREEIGETCSLIRRIMSVKERIPIAEEFYGRFDGMAAVLESRAYVMDYNDLSRVIQIPQISDLRDVISAKMDDSGLVDRDSLDVSDVLLARAETVGLVRLTMTGRKFFVAFSGLWAQ